MRKALTLSLWIIILQFVGFCLGMTTETNMEPWYQSLVKSSLTPPGYVFGVVWGVLYVMLAIVGWRLYTSKQLERAFDLRVLFITQLLFNWSWTPLFFALQWVGTALLCLITITLLNTLLLIRAWQRDRCVFLLIIPYWFWLCFACYLNTIIWLYNS